MGYLGTKPSVATSLPNNIVTADKISDGAVGTNDLANSAVTQSKIATGVAGTGPAFSVFQSSAQTLSNATYTKIQLQTEEFDTAAAFDSTTLFRFQPTVAGYYQIQALVGFAGSPSNIYTTASIYKNGSAFKTNTVFGAYLSGPTICSIVYCNGTTDYVELYCSQASGGSLNTATGAANTYFQGVLVRAA